MHASLPCRHSFDSAIKEIVQEWRADHVSSIADDRHVTVQSKYQKQFGPASIFDVRKPTAESNV